MPRYIYQFGAGEADGRSDQRALLGGKGANLAEMTSLGIPVPPGFTLSPVKSTRRWNESAI
jgi:pyruvate,orthophosphate dikinase